MVDMSSSSRWPWYSFLYRWFGAQGTFWLWIVALVGLWLSAEDAVLVLVNRTPHARSVADAASGQNVWRNWVEVEGTELRDAGRLFGELGDSGSPVRLLLDPTDPAAARWSELADAAHSLGVKPTSSSEAGRRFGRLRARFEKHLDDYRPSRPLRLFEDAAVATVSSRCSLSRPVALDEGDPIAGYEVAFRAAVQLVRENVLPGQRYKGALDRTPSSNRQRIERELGIQLSGRTLRVGRRPRRLPMRVFAACAVLLVFLAAGLQGVLARDDEASLAAAEAEGKNDAAPATEAGAGEDDDDKS